jgi:hypothetical protein
LPTSHCNFKQFSGGYTHGPPITRGGGGWEGKGKGEDWEGREGKGREGKGREGKGREGRGGEGRGGDKKVVRF